MDQIWVKAPGVHYRPHFSHALGRKVQSYREEEKALEAKGQWIATKNEANSTYGTDIFSDDVTIKKATKEKVRKHVEKAAQKLAAEGVIRSGRDGWEYAAGDSGPV